MDFMILFGWMALLRAAGQISKAMRCLKSLPVSDMTKILRHRETEQTDAASKGCGSFYALVQG
jgi:hypothetical protein